MTRSARRRLPLLGLLLCTPLFVSTTGAEQVADAGAVAAGAVCEAPADPGAAARARLERLALQAPDSDAARGVVVLNGQGYNYAAAQDREFERVQRERMQRDADPAPHGLP